MTVLTCKTAPRVMSLDSGPSLQQRYCALLHGDDNDHRAWLDLQLAKAERLSDDLPDTAAQLDTWSRDHASQVSQAYSHYLEQRRQGAPRRYFSNRAHALWFIQQVAPTKAVDGAWLQSTLDQWRDPRYHGLIRTYLEELGDGDPRCNHVLIYQRLLSRWGARNLSRWPTTATSRVPCNWPWAPMASTTWRKSSATTLATNNRHCIC